MNRKGVYFSFDAIIASVIFILAIISLFSYWYSIRETIMAEDSIMKEEALRVSNLLFLPYDSGGFGFSLSYEDKSLNVTSIEAYSVRTMEEIKVDVSTPYNLSITFEIYSLTSHLNHLERESHYEFGTAPLDNSKTISKVVRIAPTSDGRIAVVSIFVYE